MNIVTIHHNLPEKTNTFSKYYMDLKMTAPYQEVKSAEIGRSAAK